MSGPSSLRTAEPHINMLCQCESPALAVALFKLMCEHAEQFGFHELLGVEVSITAKFACSPHVEGNLNGLRQVLDEQYLGSIYKVSSDEPEASA